MFNVEHLIQSGGLLFIAAIVFAESGLLFGFFLPGDTLLLSAGVFAAQGKLSLWGLLVLVAIAAVVGDNVGYSIGRRVGPRIFRRKDGLFFRQEHIERAEQFYKRHGGKTIILARFVPVVRTFAPVVAGVSKMPRWRFFSFNLIGAVLWGVGVVLLGYWFGSRIPNIDRFIMPAIGAVVVLSFGSPLYRLFKDKRFREMLIQKLRSIARFIFLNKKVS